MFADRPGRTHRGMPPAPPPHAGDTQAPPETMRFGHLEIAFDSRVLRPRPWTAGQSRWAAELATDAPPGPLLELCAGAGQIGLLAVSTGRRSLVCVDADPVACEFARHNADAAGVGDRVEVRAAALTQALRPGEEFPVIIADPPYLRPEESAAYPEDPRTAIDGGPDGLDVVRDCLGVISDHLHPGGHALLQLRSTDQARWVRAELDPDAGLAVAETRSYGQGVVVLLRPA